MILRFCVVIPVFNNPRTISEVVNDVLVYTPFPVLIVDDGSDTPVHSVLYSWEVRHALEKGRVQILRLEKNQGKGAALRAAIERLTSAGFTHMLTMDGDGKHMASECAKLVTLSKSYPWDLIIGDRQLRSEKREERNRLRRKFSNFLVTYQTGLHVKDSQSGFRVYPLLPLQNMKFLARHSDFQSEVLIRLLWKGMHVREIEVQTRGTEPAQERGKLLKLWDGLRLSFLNTFLVIVSLFKTHRSPGEMSVALGLGVFIGCTPFFGFHTLIVAAVAFLFRLNLVVMWIGSHVSTPLLAPFVFVSEVWIGKHWLGILPEGGRKGEFYQWLGGSVVLGVGLGLGSTIVSFAVAWVLERQKKYTNWSARRRGGRLGRAILRRTLKSFGMRGGYKLILFTCCYFYFFAPKARRGIGEYWRLRSPEMGWWRRQKQILRHFHLFGRILVDRALRSLDREYQFSIAGHGVRDLIDKREKGQGCILLSAHMGAWDLAVELAIPKASLPIQLVSLRREGFRFLSFRESMDLTRNRIETRAPLTAAAAAIRSALDRGGCVAIMGDRPLGDQFQLIPFMGRLAPFDVSVFRLAAEAGVPIFFNFGFKVKKESFELFVSPPRYYRFDPALEKEVQCYAWAKEYVAEMERFVLRYPMQWFNLYPFWSAPPTELSGELAAQDRGLLVEEFDCIPGPASEGPTK